MERLRVLEAEKSTSKKVDAGVQATEGDAILTLEQADLKRKYHQALVVLAADQLLHNLEPNLSPGQLTQVVLHL